MSESAAMLEQVAVSLSSELEQLMVIVEPSEIAAMSFADRAAVASWVNKMGDVLDGLRPALMPPDCLGKWLKLNQFFGDPDSFRKPIPKVTALPNQKVLF